MFYPYFKIVYKNEQFSRLEYIVKFEVFSKTLTIIGSSGIGYPVSPPAPAAPVPQSATQQQSQTTAQPSQQIPQQTSRPTQQQSQTISQHTQHTTSQQTHQQQHQATTQNAPQVIHQHQAPQQTQATPSHLSTQQSSTQQRTSSQSSHGHSDGFEPISAELSKQAFVNDYINHIVSESGLPRSSLIGVFCQSDNPSFLSFRFRLNNGQIKEFNGSTDYIQYKLRTTKPSPSTKQIPNCLHQN
jgi:hypothetical protein